MLAVAHRPRAVNDGHSLWNCIKSEDTMGYARRARSLALRASTLAGLTLLGASAADTAHAAPNMVMLLGQAGGNPGASVEVPLLLMMANGSKGDPSDVSGLDMTISWDAALASLDAVVPTPITLDWQLAYNPSPGNVRISMASLSGVGATAIGIEVLRLRFRLADSAGETSLRLLSTRAFDGNLQPIDHLTVDGRLVVSAVETGGIRFGQLKLAFGTAAQR
jgi:hypothetical protein